MQSNIRIKNQELKIKKRQETRDKRPQTEIKASSKIVPLLFILISVLCIGGFIYWRIQQMYLSFLTVPASETAQTTNFPAGNKISIPSLDINLDIKESYIKNGVWGVNETGVSHLINSANPGEASTIVMYGHNKNQLLGKIRSINRGDMIIITTNNNKEHTYKVVNSLTVLPKDTWILQSNGFERLILYTCTGFFDLERFVVIAEPVTS